LSLPSVADDGIEWVDTPEGVQAKSVNHDSPLAYAVRKGDYVKAFFYVGRYDDGSRAKLAPRSLDYEEVARAETLSRYLEGQGVGNNARYAILHPDPVLKNIFGIKHPIYDVDFKVVARDQHLERGLYLMTHWNVIIVAPPLTVTRDEIDEGIGILDEALSIADEYTA